MTQAHPLHWPPGRPRTKRRESARFKVSLHEARVDLAEELDRLGASNPVLSTNLELRLDGWPRSNQAEPSDPGVALYFTHKGRQMCFACDRWETVRANVRAIGKTIEALRGIERWGSGDMMAAAFTGFEQLTAPGRRGWRAVLGIPEDKEANGGLISAHFARLVQQRHPDKGGSPEEFQELMDAREAAMKEVGA